MGGPVPPELDGSSMSGVAGAPHDHQVMTWPGAELPGEDSPEGPGGGPFAADGWGASLRAPDPSSPRRSIDG